MKCVDSYAAALFSRCSKTLQTPFVRRGALQGLSNRCGNGRGSSTSCADDIMSTSMANLFQDQ